MAINKKLIHFKNFSDFNSKKLSANENNTQYTLGINGAVTNGSPDILYQSICYIKDTKQQWTHGQLYGGSNSDTLLNETDPIFSASPAASITEAKKTEWDNKMDKVVLSSVATSGNYNDLTNKPTIPASVTESTVSNWGFTKNTGTYSKPTTGIPVSDLAEDIQTSLGKANTALQSYTEQYKGTVTGVKINGTTKNPSSGIVDLGTVITAHQILKTINGESIVGSGDITISGGGSSGANVQAVDTGDVLDDVTVDYATKTYVDELVGDINSVLDNIIDGEGGSSSGSSGSVETLYDVTGMDELTLEEMQYGNKYYLYLDVYQQDATISINSFQAPEYSDMSKISEYWAYIKIYDLNEDSGYGGDGSGGGSGERFSGTITLELPDVDIRWANGTPPPALEVGVYELSVICVSEYSDTYYNAVLTPFKAI